MAERSSLAGLCVTGFLAPIEVLGGVLGGVGIQDIRVLDWGQAGLSWEAVCVCVLLHILVFVLCFFAVHGNSAAD